jgi:tripartite-type tricarboxylate transporter receptor subunit TctC
MKSWKAWLAAFAACLTVASAGAADTYPSHSIRLVVPFTPAGSTDLIGRLMAEQLRQELGQPVVVENVAGASGAVGTMQVARAAPDGYTLLVATVSTMIVYPAAHEKADYSLADFAPITNIASMPNVISVTPSFPANNLTEFIKVLKASPGKYTFGTSGVGSINHMLGESFQAYSGTKIVHIPYKGSGPAMNDVMGGRVDILFDQFPSSKGYIDSGKLKAIGVISPKRIPGYDVMTMEEAGMKGFTDEAWYGLLAPAKVPPDVLARLTQAVNKALANPDLRAKLEKIGARPVGNTPSEFAAQVKSEIERMKVLVKDRNIKLDD